MLHQKYGLCFNLQGISRNLFRGIITCTPQNHTGSPPGRHRKSTIMLNSIYALENTKTRRKIVLSSFPLLYEAYTKLHKNLFSIKYPDERWYSQDDLKATLQIAGRITVGDGNWAIIHFPNIFIKTSAEMSGIEKALDNEASEGPYVNII